MTNEVKNTLKRVVESWLLQYCTLKDGDARGAALWDEDARMALVDALTGFEAVTGLEVMCKSGQDMLEAKRAFQAERTEHDGIKEWCNIFISDDLTGVTYEMRNVYGPAMIVFRVIVQFYSTDSYHYKRGGCSLYSVEVESYTGKSYKIASD